MQKMVFMRCENEMESYISDSTIRAKSRTVDSVSRRETKKTYSDNLLTSLVVKILEVIFPD
jgi:hypothetical protein